jgi:putative endonuclease
MPHRPPSTAPRERPALGRAAERLACQFLQSRGLRLIAANVTTPAGELDLVMRDGVTLVFIEVRYRRRADPVHPVVTVDRRKRRHLLQAAALCLRRLAAGDEPPVRFDVVAVSGPLAAPRCEWWRGAFDASDA